MGYKLPPQEIPPAPVVDEQTKAVGRIAVTEPEPQAVDIQVHVEAPK